MRFNKFDLIGGTMLIAVVLLLIGVVAALLWGVYAASA